MTLFKTYQINTIQYWEECLKIAKIYQVASGKRVIARTMIRNAQTLILDEPSSSLDPITEANLFRKLIDISKDKTSILSHTECMLVTWLTALL